MKKISYRIEYDEITGNPRDEFDNISTFYGVNGHYIIGGKKDQSFSYRDSLEDAIQELRKEKAIIVEFSNNAGTCYAVVERKQLQKEYLDHGYSMRKALYWARKCAEREIETFNAWANGEVFGYIVEDEDGNILDSCWGFYGRDDVEIEAQNMVNYYTREARKEDDEILERLDSVCKL